MITLKQQTCIMFLAEKGLLNFVSERIKLVYRINNTCLAFQTSKTTNIYRPQTSELKSISKFKLLFHWKNFKKLIYELLYSNLKQVKKELINYEIRVLYHSR